MDLSIYQIGLTLSFLVTLIVVLRLYRGVRILNARVSILSNLVRELRNANSPAKAPTTEEESKEDEMARVFVDELAEERELQTEMLRDFSFKSKQQKQKI